MDKILTHLAAAPRVSVPEGSWLGDITAAGLGATLIVVPILLCKKELVFWGPKCGPWIDKLVTDKDTGKKKLDWLSLLSFLFGFAGVTAILGSSEGPLQNIFEWLQGLFIWLREIPIINEIGMVPVCAVCLIMAMRKENDSLQDIRWGSISGLALPLGGGIFAQFTVWVAQGTVGLLSLGTLR